MALFDYFSDWLRFENASSSFELVGFSIEIIFQFFCVCVKYSDDQKKILKLISFCDSNIVISL